MNKELFDANVELLAARLELLMSWIELLQVRLELLYWRSRRILFKVTAPVWFYVWLWLTRLKWRFIYGFWYPIRWKIAQFRNEMQGDGREDGDHV